MSRFCEEEAVLLSIGQERDRQRHSARLEEKIASRSTEIAFREPRSDTFTVWIEPPATLHACYVQQFLTVSLPHKLGSIPAYR